MNDEREDWPRATEERLDALRRQALEQGRVTGAGVVPSGAPFPIASGENGYYGLPLLKKPVWTWEVPTYLFAGGAAGVAALLAEVAQRTPGAGGLARDARWMAAIGGGVSAPLLIADLGRPERFLNMLRVFKPQSPMSAGAWIVLAFSSATAASLAAQLFEERFSGRLPVRVAGRAAGTAAAAAGVGMATYTGVLIGVTTVPVWASNATMLPVHFAASALGTAVSVLQLLGHQHPALRRLGLLAAAVETLVGARLESSGGPANEPVRHGRSGWLMRASGVLAGPVPLLLRAFGRSPAAQRAAAISTIAGSLFTRYGWIAAGRQSAADPREPLALPAHARRTAPAAVVPGSVEQHSD